MHRFKTLTFLCVVLVTLVAGLTIATVSPPACRLQVIRDYITPIAYKAVLQLPPACAAGTVLRVRKSSTMNVRRNGAPYQPIRPEAGAWEVGNSYSKLLRPVPANELWTPTLMQSWRWEWWDANEWNTRTNSQGRWMPGEVLNATPRHP